MKLYVLDNGKIVMSARNEVTVDQTEGGETPSIPIHSFLLETDGARILFDTACDPDAEQVWPAWLLENPYIMGENGSVPDRLAQLGLKPEDIDIVVMSHLHMDHAGCLRYFTGAKVYVHEDELEMALQGYASDTLEGTFHLASDIRNILKAGIRFRPVDRDLEEVELCKGVKILNLGKGHSFGMLALYVELECGNLILAADAVYSGLHFGPPALMAGICYDEEGYYKAIEKIRTYAQAHNAKVLYGHDMDQFRSLIKSTEGYYQ